MITVRRAEPEDLEIIIRIADACEMSHALPTENCLIAFEDSWPVGFMRLEFVNAVPYVRPIAVLPAKRGKGVAKRLLGIVLAKFGEVRVVSRGTATEFYRSLGFQRMSWDEVYSPFRGECQQCSDREDCSPLPMVRPATSEFRL